MLNFTWPDAIAYIKQNCLKNTAVGYISRGPYRHKLFRINLETFQKQEFLALL